MLSAVYSGRYPGDYYTVALAKGVRSPANTRPVLVAGQKTSAGTGTVNVVTLATSPEDGREKGGSGSGLALGVQGVFRGGPTAVVYVLPVGVGTGTAGTKDIIFGGTATAAGELQVQVGREIVPVIVEVGDTGDVVGAAVQALFDATAPTNADAPVVATWVGGTHTLTYTAKDTGAESAKLRYAFRNIPAGVTIAAGGVDIESVLGAGAGDPAYSAAFAAAFAEGMPDYDLIVPCCLNAAAITTATTGLKARITANCSASVMRQMNAVLGMNTTLSDATTWSAGLDDGGTGWDEPGWRWQVVWASGNWALPWEIAAVEVGLRATKTASNRNFNWCGKRGVELPGIYPPSSVTSYPSRTDIEAALVAGVTPVRYERNELGFQYGLAKVVRPITCKFSTGGQQDLRASDTNIPDVAQAVAKGMNTYLADSYDNCTITDDVDGAPPAILPENCFTPSMKRAKAIARYKSYYCQRLGWCSPYYVDENGQTQDIADLFVCEIDVADPTADNGRWPINALRWNMRSGHAFEEIGPG